ncbi:MAG: hypothetical protein ACI4PL_05505 [Faecousia sp.]
MTLGEIIDRVDRLRYNTFSREEKLGWLLQLEYTVKRNILDTHEGGLPFSQPEANAPTLAPEDFAGMYLKWLEAQIDLYSGELERYNASISLFNTEYAAFESWYNRTFPPKAAGRFRW